MTGSVDRLLQEYLSPLFVRQGYTCRDRIFVKETPLQRTCAVVEIKVLDRRDDPVERFTVRPAIVVPELTSWYTFDGLTRAPASPTAAFGMNLALLEPSLAWHAGAVPGHIEADPTWGFSSRFERETGSCGTTLADAVEERVLPLLEEASSDRDRLRDELLRHQQDNAFGIRAPGWWLCALSLSADQPDDVVARLIRIGGALVSPARLAAWLTTLRPAGGGPDGPTS